MVAVQLPAAPMVQFCVAGVPGPAVMFTVHTVPAGAFTKPEPSLTLMWHVSTWLSPTGSVSVSGVIWMFASTNVFTAGPLFGATPFVETVNADGVPRVPVQLALPVTLPAEFDVNVIVH